MRMCTCVFAFAFAFSDRELIELRVMGAGMGVYARMHAPRVHRQYTNLPK
jgi:hypothetical protein